MALRVVQEAAELRTALEQGSGLQVVGFFGAFSKLSQEAQPKFEAFCRAQEGQDAYLVDVGRIKGIHKELGVQAVPTVVALEGGVVVRQAVGVHSAEMYERLLLPPKTPSSQRSKGDGAQRSHSVVVYVSPSCSWCTRAKAYLRRRGVGFREVDVSLDPAAAQALVARSGQTGVPQLDIDGQMVVGFDRARIDRLLGLTPQADSGTTAAA